MQIYSSGKRFNQIESIPGQGEVGGCSDRDDPVYSTRLYLRDEIDQIVIFNSVIRERLILSVNNFGEFKNG